MNLLTIVCKNLWHQKMRSGLTILGVGISIAAFVSLSGLTDNLEKALQSTYKARGSDLVVMEKSTLDIFSSSIDQSYVTSLKLLPHVKQASPILFYFYAVNFKQYFLLYGWEPDSYLFEGFKITGSPLQSDHDALVGAVAAKRLNKVQGDKINVRGEEFRICGVFQSMNLLEESGIIVPLSTLQKIKKTPDKITAINLRLDYGGSLKMSQEQRQDISKQVQEKISSEFGDLEVKDVQDFVSTPFAVVFSFTWAISVVVFIIVVMGIINTMSTAVLERRKEIGILLAIGWRKYRIVILVLLEAAIYGLLGGIIGIILGCAMTRSLITAPAVQGFISMMPDNLFIIKSLGLSMLVGVLAGIYPAVKAVSIEPIDVLRYE
ncbi:MAG TPA: ABC transporter permease [Candidatus Wunengus sp. YC61]|uniref:ABC transporter permease n=1 Tax=Candidatus Wunengus sp. YC61 TaxID=3367698 RepID=UPI004026C437